MVPYLLFIVGFLSTFSSGSYYWEWDSSVSTDPRLRQLGNTIWANKKQLLAEAENHYSFPSEIIDIARKLISEEDSLGPDELDISCLQCRTLLTTLRGFINQDLEFEDIRDFALDICYNVSSSMGWNGEIMCEGLIDIFGPHVYWILNETDKRPREICEFHFTCPVEGKLSSYSAKKSTKKSSNSVLPADLEKVLSNTKQRKHDHKKKIIKIAHITDAHLDEKYTPGAPNNCPGLPVCCRDYLPGTGETSEWVERGCALAVPTLHVILRYINELGVDMVINTGDTPNHALWEETLEGQLRQSEILADGIKEFIPGVPAHISIGNHDTYPTNQFYGPSPYIKDLLHHIRTMYQDLANFTDEQAGTFEHGGYYTSLLLPGLRLMVYNTEYSYTDNYYGVLLEETSEYINMKQFMEDTFDYARANGEKILLVSHHAMGMGFTFFHDFITDIMSRNGDLVFLHLLGHTHYEMYKMGLDDNGDAFHVNMMTSSLFSQRNPAFKIFSIDTETLTPLGFETYFFNISQPIAEGDEPVIEFMYSSSADYGMPDLTAASFQNFTDRMEMDDDLFNEFRWNEYTRYVKRDPCVDDCKKSYFCNLRTVSRYEYNDCMAS